jgi:hypothetical protein
MNIGSFKTPIVDHRNYCLWAILVPYLLNVKRLSENDTVKVLGEWLDKCNSLRRLSFDPRSKVQSTIKGNKGFEPISLNKLKYKNKDLFLLLEGNTVI